MQVDGAQLTVVTDDDERGRALEVRRLDLGIKSVRALHIISQEQSFGLSRKAIANAEKGVASEDTFKRVDALLRRLEAIDRDPDEDDGIDEDEDTAPLIEFEVRGAPGVRVFVRGPLSNRDELEESAARLIARAASAQKRD